jgi:hypothetical protein
MIFLDLKYDQCLLKYFCFGVVYVFYPFLKEH